MLRTASVGLCVALCWGMPVLAQGNLSEIGSNKLTKSNLAFTMNWDSCQKFSHSMSGIGVCGIKPCGKDPCVYIAPQWSISYWEPSALIEVSCRSGYSMLKPGGVPARHGANDEKSLQSCYVPTGKGGRRWFFEARVWAINGYPNATREQSSGGSHAEEARSCTQDQHDITKGQFWGYGKKWEEFKPGGGGGPGNSWTAYISDQDPSWAKDTNNTPKNPPTQKECKEGGSVEDCWGPLIKSGWVSHPNQAVAAALAGWRAHEAARQAGTVSPPGNGGGYKINMDFPFIKNTSEFAQSMKFEGGSGYKGSSCFKPGDPGSSWYTNQEKSIKPEELPAFIQKLQAGDITKKTEVNSGVYIFTAWVYTACKRYGRFGDQKAYCTSNPNCTSEPHDFPGDGCKYKGES